MKEKTKRFLSLLLTAVLLVTAQGFTALADTVSQNDTQNPAVIEETDTQEDVSADAETDVQIVAKADADLDGEVEIEPGAASGDQAPPANPVHHCRNYDETDWSYIYFGNYPQSEETDSSVIAAIDSAIAEGNGTVGADDTGTDVLVNGTKYRRISKKDTNDVGYCFDRKPKNNGYRYFKWEPIKWRVLDNNDNGTLFVMADSALDCKDYNDKYTSITWENSTIRDWLNNSFYNTAFSSSEQDVIVAQNVVNNVGNDTTDKVYLLSEEEVKNVDYGFCGKVCYSVFAPYSLSLRLRSSSYANARGASISTESGYEGNCWWWLRSLGGSSSNAEIVDYGGYVERYGYDVDDDNEGVAPALHIDLSSDIWSVTGDGSSGGGEYLPANPVHHCTKADATDWSYIYFGSYPQGEETDRSVIAAIDSAIAEGNGAAGADDTGTDVWVNGTKYRRISKDDTNDGGYCFNKKPANNGYRYFKWERIKWRVLDNNDNGTLFVAADTALDCKCYNNDKYVDITWENSTIRSWLNGGFYNTAFSNSEQNAIVAQNVVNEDNPDYNTEGGNDTIDKVYLLSIGEVTNVDYGFCSYYWHDQDEYSVCRWLQPSNYSRARGTSTESDSLTGNNANCFWWLRSPGDRSVDAAIVTCYGGVARSGNDVAYGTDGVVPALHINLSSDLWSVADDSTSGEGGGNVTGGGNKPQTPSDQQPTQPAAPQPAGTHLTASQVTSKTDDIPQGASFTVTSSDASNPTASFDGVSDENAQAVTIPKTITYNGVEYKVTAVSLKSFTQKKDNAKFTVKDGSVENLSVEYKAPASANKTKLSVPEYTTYKGIKFKVTSVAAKAFKNNKKTTQISIGGSATKIGDSAFEGCKKLKSVTVGKNVQTIGKNAFKNCTKLTKITVKSTKLKTVGKNALKGVNAKCVIKVPSKQLKKYQTLFKKKGQKSSVKIKK